MSPAPACISIPSVAGQWAARGPVSIITTHLVEHLECYYEVELQTKVHSKVRNHGEGLYYGILLVESGYYHFHI